MKKFMWLLSLTALLSFTSCGEGDDEAKELLQRLLRLVGIPHDIVVNICQDNNKNGFCESIEPRVSIIINQEDTAQTLWQKITETANGQYLLETYDPTKPILLELQDVAKVNFDEGKFTLNFDGYATQEQNSTKELSILQSMVDTDAISVTEADKFRTLINQEAQDKFYRTLLSDLETNLNTLRTNELDKTTAMSATIKEMADEIKANQEQADKINACENNQTCVNKEIKKISDELIITDSEVTEIKAKEQPSQETNTTTPKATPTPMAVEEVISDDKWVKPSQSICENSGGAYNKYIENDNDCNANWENAQTICSASGGVLPNIESLRAVITDCGGEMEIGEHNVEMQERNQNNESYQACLIEKGFISNRYWSSTTYTSDTIRAWGVALSQGDEGIDRKTAEHYVRCIKE